MHRLLPFPPARRYPLQVGWLLNIGAVAEDFQIRRGRLYFLLANGSLKVNGKPIKAVVMSPRHRGRKENAYVDSEVAKALEALKREREFPIGGWENAYTWKDSTGRILIARRGIRKLFPQLNPGTIHRWADKKHGLPCRFLRNARGARRFIESDMIRPPAGSNARHSKVRVFLKGDLERIVAAMIEAQPTDKVVIGRQARWRREAVYTDEGGRTWPTDVQLAHGRGVDRNWIYYWSHRKSKFDSGRMALRSKPIPNHVNQEGSPGEINVFLDDDANTILCGQESNWPRGGRGKFPAGIRAARGKELLLSILPDSEAKASPRYIFEEARKVGLGTEATRRVVDAFAIVCKDQHGKEHYCGKPSLYANGAMERLKALPARNARGRKRDPVTAKLYELCHTAYTGPGKRATQLHLLQTALQVEKIDPRKVPDVATMRLYSKRFATR